MMADYSWPKYGEASLLGTDMDRVDGLAKSTGAALYSYDEGGKDVLIANALGCPHAHCTVKSIDVSEAKKVPGVRSVHLMKEPGNEIRWQGDLIAAVAAETEGAAAEGVAAIKVEYEMLDVFVDDEDLAGAEAAGRMKKGGENTELEEEPGDDDDEDEFNDAEIDRLLKASAATVEGYYGIHAITHMCLEPHGSTCEWDGDKLTAHLSTQNVSGTGGQMASALKITSDDVTVHCDYIGGGFGSKFSPDNWAIAAAQISRETGRPVKLMLPRDIELKVAGNRPSGFIEVRIGADKDGVVTVWDSKHWGTGGPSGGGVTPQQIPYVFTPPNHRSRQFSIQSNTAPQRAWRAPNHPQACAMSQTAYDDIAAKLGLDSYDVFMRNLPTASNGKADVYADQMKTGAKLIDWKSKWHPHGKGDKQGSVVGGLGMALHQWGGGANFSNCNLKIHPDGGVETFLASQDLGTGTRTVVAAVVAETFGLPVGAVKVNLGNSKYPASGPSGGSTTVGGVSESNRRASQDALAEIFAKAAPKLEAKPEELEAKEGRIQVRGDSNRGMSWKQACALLGMKPLEVQGRFNRGKSTLSDSGVAGVQMVEVAVDTETGIVKVKKFVAVQDMGLVVSAKTARSQMYGAAIMGIAYALFEERIMDDKTGAFLNCELGDYKLPRLGDIGDIVIELYQPESEYSRGVIGLGEPPVISPGAAISNAVCNALGVRVPVLPLTPQRVIEALEKARKS
jgi:xanthine dehydrogenase YagR molybdenum-binding subunit